MHTLNCDGGNTFYKKIKQSLGAALRYFPLKAYRKLTPNLNKPIIQCRSCQEL